MLLYELKKGKMNIGRTIFVLWGALLLVNFVFAVPYPATAPLRILEALKPVAAAWPGLPAAEDFLSNWGYRIQSIFLAGMAALAAVSAGRYARLLIGIPTVAGLWLDGALGLGMLGLSVLGAGLAGILFGGVTGMGILLMILLGTRFVAELGAGTGQTAPVPEAAGWAAVITSILWILGVLNPEAGIDAWVYHLRIPLYYQMHHKVYFVWHHIHGHMPQLWDAVFSLFPPALAATSAQFLSALCAMAIFGMMIRCSPSRETKMTALLVISSPLVVGVGTMAYTDLPMMWLGFGAFVLLFHPSPDPPASRRFASGVVLSLAASIKYAAFPILAAQAAWLAAESIKRRRPGWWIPAGVGFIFGFSPWLAWNFLDTGNPFFPFLKSFFPHSLSPLPFADQVSSMAFARSLERIACSGWNGFVQTPPFLFISPFFLLLLPVLLLPRRRRIDPPGAGMWLGVYGVSWALTIADERFMLAAVPVLALAMLSQKPALRWKTIFALFFALNAAGVMRGQFVSPRLKDLSRFWASLGIESHRGYLGKALEPSPGFSEAADWINEGTGRDERVLIVADYKSHLIWRECIHDHVYDQPTRLLYILRGAGDDADRMAVKFRQLGIGWVLYLPSRCNYLLRLNQDRFPFTSETARAFGKFWVARAVQRACFPEAVVYEIRYRPGAPALVADLPGVTDVAKLMVEEREKREGKQAAIELLRKYVEAYPMIGAFHGMLGVEIMKATNDPALLVEARHHLTIARRAGNILQ